MKYIEKVILENFQSHKNTVVEFDHQLNVIVGPSDSGKTAILRGIRWALYNEPSGDYFIREGETECSVTIVFDDGTKIKRYRNKSKNSYLLYDSDNNEMKFEGFGTSVPEEIINKTGIKKILLDSDLSNAINLSDQLEGAFLLSERGSARANSIGRLVGVNIIDDALRESLKDSRNLSNSKKIIEDNISNLENELLGYAYLDELSHRIELMERIRNQIQEKKERIHRYRNLLQRYISIHDEKKMVYFYIEKLEGIGRVSDIVNKASSKITMFNYFTNQNDRLHKLYLNKEESASLIKDLKDLSLAESNINRMISTEELRMKLINYSKKLKSVRAEIGELKSIESHLKNIDLLKNRINSIDDRMEELKKLININKKYSELKERLGVGKEYVNRLQKIDDLSQYYINLNEKITLIHKLTGLAMTYKFNENEIQSEKLNLQKFKDQVDMQLLNYKDLLMKQEKCPLCFSIIDNDKIEHIISHYN